jgi:hypothetical protein
LSDKHHISASFDTVALDSLNNTGGFAYSLGSSDPFSSFNTTRGTNFMVRVIDNYTLSPTLLNTFSIGFSRTPSIQGAQQLVDAGKYGFSINSNAFPLITYGNSSNGVLENSPSPERCSRPCQSTAKYQGNAINTSAAAIPPNSQKNNANPIWNRTVTWLADVLFCTANQTK